MSTIETVPADTADGKHAPGPLAGLPDMLTVEELQEYLRVGRAAAYTFARLHGVRIGRLLRVPRTALHRASF